AKPVIGPPVHAFRPVGERLQHVWAPSKSHSNFLRLTKPAIMYSFLLGCIGKAGATTACEQSAGDVQQRHAAPAGPPTRIGRAAKPRATATKMAGRPRDRYPLFHRLPLSVFPASAPKR